MEGTLTKNIIGWVSVFLILLGYALLTFEVVRSSDVLYNLINLFGAVGLAWRVYQDRNWSNFALEVAFIIIALIALIK